MKVSLRYVRRPLEVNAVVKHFEFGVVRYLRIRRCHVESLSAFERCPIGYCDWGDVAKTGQGTG